MTMMKNGLTLLSAAMLIFALGCDATTVPENETDEVTEEVAASISTLIGEESGEFVEQVGDVFEGDVRSGDGVLVRR